MAVLESFAEGVRALFYEPYKGAVLGPEEFVLGLGVGVKNFLGYTVGLLAVFSTSRSSSTASVFYYSSRETQPRRNVYWPRPSMCLCVCVCVSVYLSHTTARTRM